MSILKVLLSTNKSFLERWFEWGSSAVGGIGDGGGWKSVRCQSTRSIFLRRLRKSFVYVLETWSLLQIGSLPPLGRAWERGANWCCFKCANWHQCTKCFFLHKMCKLTPLQQMCKSANWHFTKRCRPMHQVRIQLHQIMGCSWCRKIWIWGERLRLSENKTEQYIAFQCQRLKYVTFILSWPEKI